MITVEPFTPIQYIVGRAEFCGLDFCVDENVLIPRPETEGVVEAALDLSRRIQPTIGATKILDLCTGSGNVAISLAAQPDEALTKLASDCKMVASDISGEALEVAKKNAEMHGVLPKIEFVKSDLFENITGKFNIITVNPPYIARHEFGGLQKEVLKEPRTALDGGEDGLDFYRKISREAPAHMEERGYLVMEIGFGQAGDVSKIMEAGSVMEVTDIRKDSNGIERIVVLRKQK